MMNKKPALIILPGWGGNDLLWQYQLQHLSEIAEVKVITITHQNSMQGMVQEIIHQAPDQFILCGHSLGGWAAQWLAIQFPERVKKLILMGTWSGESTPTLITLFQEMRKKIIAKETKKLLDEIRPTLISPSHLFKQQLMTQIEKAQQKFPDEGLINQLDIEIEAKNTSPMLKNIQCPTLIIHGRHDSFFPLSMAKELQNKIPHAKFTMIENCGHMLPIEQPEAITALIYLWAAANS